MCKPSKTTRPGWHGVALSLLLISGQAARAASFDCQRSSTAVEQAICADKQSSEMDTRLAESYRQTLTDLDQTQASGLKLAQRAWLRQRNSCLQQASVANCLYQMMLQRLELLNAQDKTAKQALNAIIATIPAQPANAARQLRQYHNGLASAWLVYLHQFDPASGVSAAEARQRHQIALQTLKNDEFAWSLMRDIEADPKSGQDYAVLTLLRMQLERRELDDDRCVHAFVFQRQGEVAYRAMGSLYGTSRDSWAPLCGPRGNLFQHASWKQLRLGFEPLLDAAIENSGTIRSSYFANWRVLELRATLSPRDYLSPAMEKQAGSNPTAIISDWKDQKTWPTAQRQQVLQAITPCIRSTAQWLQQQRGLSAAESARAARVIVFDWMNQRLAFADENLGD